VLQLLERYKNVSYMLISYNRYFSRVSIGITKFSKLNINNIILVCLDNIAVYDNLKDKNG
jgi:hypothetical protein